MIVNDDIPACKTLDVFNRLCLNRVTGALWSLNLLRKAWPGPSNEPLGINLRHLSVGLSSTPGETIKASCSSRIVGPVLSKYSLRLRRECRETTSTSPSSAL